MARQEFKEEYNPGADKVITIYSIKANFRMYIDIDDVDEKEYRKIRKIADEILNFLNNGLARK